MISPQTIQQITNRIDIVDVIGDFIKLKKRGANYLGLCPFHGEKTPSFTVSPSKEIFKCFGCGKSGNTITFLMEHEHFSYVEALKWLADRYHIDVEETEVSDEVKEARLVSESLYIINGFAQKFFTEQLNDTEEGQNIARTYLYERGFNDDIIEKFQLGYNPQDRDIFVRNALQKQYSEETLLKTGLVSRWPSGEIVDNYRGRIIFPVHNTSGKILGFGARVIGKADKKSPKYINTPENEIYNKSKILYGAYFARQAIDKLDECLLVEGYTDVISLYQAGVENVVSSGGTSLTVDQLRLIKKYTNNLTIIYDGDAAGIKAALRGLDMALEQSLNVHLVLIPDGEDPDSYVRKVGEVSFRTFVQDNKKDIILFQLDVMMKDAGNDISKKNEVVNHIAETLSKIDRAEDFTKQQDYIRQCSAVLKIDEGGLTSLVNKYKRDRVSKDEFRTANKSIVPEVESGEMPGMIDSQVILTNAEQIQERNVLRVLLEEGLHPFDENRTIADYIFEEIAAFTFEDPQLNLILNEYRAQYEQGKEPSVKTFLYHDDENVRKLIIDITLFPFDLSPRWRDMIINFDEEAEGKDILDAKKSIAYFKLRKIKQVMSETEDELQKTPTDERLMQLLQVYQALKHMEMDLTKELGNVILK